MEKLTPKERSALIKAIGMEKADVDAAQKLESRAKKVEKELQSARLQRPSAVYRALIKVPGEQLLFLLVKSTQRLVLDRIRNFYQKYLPTALEVTDREVAAAGVQPGTPKFAKLKEQMINTRLDARPKKVPPPVEAPPPPPAPSGPMRKHI
jgi:tRNA nucleotidyltransferase (CCA-adding enzyme)